MIGVDSDLVRAPFEVVPLMLECLDYSYHFLIRGCVPLGWSGELRRLERYRVFSAVVSFLGEYCCHRQAEGLV